MRPLRRRRWLLLADPDLILSLSRLSPTGSQWRCNSSCRLVSFEVALQLLLLSRAVCSCGGVPSGAVRHLGHGRVCCDATVLPHRRFVATYIYCIAVPGTRGVTIMMMLSPESTPRPSHLQVSDLAEPWI